MNFEKMKSKTSFIGEAAKDLEEIKEELEKDEWHMVTDWMMQADIDEEMERKIVTEWPS